MIIYIVDLDGRCVLVNSLHGQILLQLGMVGESIIGKTVYDMFPRDIADKIRENECKVLAENKLMEFEEELPSSADSMHTFLTVRFPLCDDNGKPYGLCSIATDITERKKADEKLRKSEEFLGLTLESAPIGITTTDVEGKILSCNPFASEFSGYSQDELIGKNIDELRSVLGSKEEESKVSKLRQDLYKGEIDNFEIE